MNIFATIVACYGLLADNAAVVIGAMIIALLLEPIIGIALGLIDGDNQLLFKALLAEIAGIALVLIIAFIIGKIHQDIPLGKEIYSRTAPNLLDLIVALASGAAGAYAIVSPRVNVGIVGVAIATALVPPLSTSSLLLARGEFQLAFGAFLLFFANFVAIQISSSIVLWLHGYHRVNNRYQGPVHLFFRNVISFGLLISIALTLSLSFKQAIAKQKFETAVHYQLLQALQDCCGAVLIGLGFDRKSEKMLVTAVVRTLTALTPQQVETLEAKLPQPAQGKLELHLYSILATETIRESHKNP